MSAVMHSRHMVPAGATPWSRGGGAGLHRGLPQVSPRSQGHVLPDVSHLLAVWSDGLCRSPVPCSYGTDSRQIAALRRPSGVISRDCRGYTQRPASRLPAWTSRSSAPHSFTAPSSSCRDHCPYRLGNKGHPVHQHAHQPAQLCQRPARNRSSTLQRQRIAAATIPLPQQDAVF